jgi:hypothetical protein
MQWNMHDSQNASPTLAPVTHIIEQKQGAKRKRMKRTQKGQRLVLKVRVQGESLNLLPELLCHTSHVLLETNNRMQIR